MHMWKVPRLVLGQSGLLRGGSVVLGILRDGTVWSEAVEPNTETSWACDDRPYGF